MRARLGACRAVPVLTVLLSTAYPITTPAVLAAQDSVRQAAVPTTAKSLLQEFIDSVGAADSVQQAKRARIVPPQCPVGDQELHADSAVMQSCREAWAQYFDYQRFGLAHREGVFRWQLLSSEITFVVVVLLVLVGVFFSWLQFRAELPRRRQSPGSGQARIEKRLRTEAGGTADHGEDVVVRTQSVHQVKAGAVGVEVNSPVLGVIILTLSLLFFYFYLKFVYPIHETF